MRRPRRWLVVAVAMVLAGPRRAARVATRRRDRIVSEGEQQPRAELAVIALLLCAAASALAFILIYGFDRLSGQTQLLGLALGCCFAFLSAAAILASKRLVVDEEIEEAYPEPHPEAEEEVVQITEESATRLTRKGLLLAAGGAAGGTLGLALLTPAVSLGPAFDTGVLRESAWRRGRRIVDEKGVPYRAGDIEVGSFYTAFPENEAHDRVSSPLLLVRLDPATLELPPDRAGWAPQGILAYSKICTHAGCAVSMYRYPLFQPTSPRPSFVCPCHYSTFDPAAGGKVLFGPAGRPLPQLPLMIVDDVLVAAGGFSGQVGPAWPGVRSGGTHYAESEQ